MISRHREFVIAQQACVCIYNRALDTANGRTATHRVAWFHDLRLDRVLTNWQFGHAAYTYGLARVGGVPHFFGHSIWKAQYSLVRKNVDSQLRTTSEHPVSFGRLGGI